MTIKFTVYDAATGVVLRTGSALTEATARLQGNTPGTRVTLVGSDPATQVISVTPIGIDGSNLPRQPMQANGTPTTVNKTTIVANGTDAVVISNIPAGAKYDIYLPVNLGLVQPDDAIVNDGSLTLTTTVAGAYSVKLALQPFLDFTVNFNAG